nr:titin homolog isoform X12 [Helicoverpa armigera]
MGSNCCKGDAGGRPLRSSSSIYSRSRAGASLDERFQASDDAGGVRLTVSSARTGDTNVYTLQASNAAGSDTSRVRLEVCADEAPTGEDPPTFLRRLQDLTVKVGTRTRFLVEIVSSTECKVTWFRNERRLLEAERVALARDGNFWCADVAAISVDDAGRWTCTAENAGGRASCSAHLNVLVPKAYKRPEFVEELRALLTEQGTVSLECKVVGVPTPVLRWFKDSREIKAGDVFALTANAEDPTSLGTYTCEAVNCMGRAYSSSKVHVVGRGSREGSARPSTSSVTPEPPPIFTKELEDQFVRVCEPLTLGCHVVVPPWPRSVVWYNKEGKVEPSERYHVLEDGAGGYLLEVPCAEWPDEGEWKCVATSSGGRVGISTCYVTMDVPKNYRKPRFMENLQAVLTEEGLVSFECKVVGFPTPVLSWFKDGQELKPGDVYQLTGTNSLGSYCCIARNCMGQASSSAELTVEDIQNQLNEEEKLQLFSKNQAPKFIQGLKSVEAKIDEPFRFSVKVAIPPEPSVLWYRDDQPVDESSRCHHGREDRGVFYLDIQSLEFLDQAEWKCVAMNDFGHSVTSCFLKLIIPRHYKKPRFLENLQAILSDEGAVNLECKVIGVPQPVLKWYKDGEELKPGDIHRIISGQDGTCCLGTYTCEAQNCMGIAASSASLLGFDDSMKAKKKKAEEQALQRNLSLSTIHEERTSQMYDTPVGDVTTLDDKGEISFSFDGKEVSVSLYETPDLTEEEALQIVEMYADQLSENITEHNVVELPPLRFVKETSTSGNLLMEAVIIDVSPDYFVPDEDMRTEADIEDISIADENGPPQLSLDQDIGMGGEDYLEKTMAMLSEEKSDVSLKLGRKKSDSQRSADDFFSLSRDQSLSEEKRDDDTQAISDLQSFASAHSSGKPKSKSSKPSGEDGQESSEPTKTILFKDEVLRQSSFEAEPSPVIKPKRERRTSRSSRRSSSGSEKSVSKAREDVLRKKEFVEIELPKKPSITDEEFKNKMVNISTSLSKVINDVQIIERDIILKSELMSSAATASRSLEIISSLISPLSEIHSIADAVKESAVESKEVSSTLFNSLPQPLKALQQSLAFIEKCIDMESDSRTLVKKTCVAFIETCGSEMQKLITDINSVTATDYLLTEDRVLTEIESLNKEMSTVIKFSADTIKARNLLSEASEIKVDEPSLEVKHLRDTQKAVFELKSPLMSLLCIAESAGSGKIIDVAKVRNSEVILNDMSGSIQDLQTALEQIETLSVKESTSPLHKYNTEIIETVMESVVKLRTSFEQLSTESEGEDQAVLKEAVASIKENLNKISSQIEVIEKNVGTFDVLQSENKLDALQKMAQILIALENNLPRLEPMPEIKKHMTVFHKNLTKVLENVIESNESKKYFTLLEICDAVNRINASIKNLDVDNVLPLASLHNTLRIIQDQFITNVFDSELNCSLLTNIADTLVGIQEAINTAEEITIHVDSEHVQAIAPHEYGETKAKVAIEHIDHAIAAIENVKAIESTQEFKSSITPTLENICPVLEELKKSIASTKASGIEEEYISDISDKSSFAQTFATPLCELNQNIIVLNQQIVENIESFKQNSEIITTVAEPLHELHTTLEILQQDVISQYGEDLTPFDVSVNMASAVQNLQSCILMIQEQAGVEAADEMSTLEDISGIKTTADTLPSDRLVLPTAEETAIEQAILPFNQKVQSTATAQALQTLNEHITVLQTPEIIDALDTLSEVSDYSSLKSFVIGLGELHSGIEEVLHPLIMEGSNEIPNLLNPSKLTAIAEPMQELQQSLSVLDTSNIPIYENLLEMPTERIHSVIQSVSEFKEHLDKCMLAVFPAMQTADNTVEIANKVGTLREVCEHLKDIIETTKTVENIPVPEEVKALERTVDSLLDATDVSKGIKIDQVKTITEELYEKVATVQEDLIQFTPQAPEKLAKEVALIQTIDEVQSNIAVLEQYDFVDLSRASDLTCTSPQVAVEIESDSLMLMEDIVDSAVNVVQDSKPDLPMADLMIVEDFFKTCKNEFTILRCLISKATTHKKIIRLLQEFTSLQSTINDFKIKKSELKLTDDLNGCLTTFLIHADDCLENVQSSLVKIVDSQAELLIKAPLDKFENSVSLLETVKKTKDDKQIIETVDKFVQIIETAKSSLQNIQTEVVDEIKSARPSKIEDSTLSDMIEEFATFIEAEKLKNEDMGTTEMLEKVSVCIEKHNDFKDASGTGKTLILLKCLSDCTDILQESLLQVKIPKQKLEEGPLKAVLTEMLEPLQALHSQLTNVQEQVLRGVDEDSISVDITTTESLVQTMTEKHKEMMERMETEEVIANEEISLIMEVDKEIHSIQDSLRSLENAPVAQVVKEIAKPVEDIEKSMHSFLTSEKTTAYSEELPKDVNSNIDSLESAIDRFIGIEMDLLVASGTFSDADLNESLTIASELQGLLALNPDDSASSKISELKTKKIKSLKAIMSKFDWQSTEVYNDKNPLEIENMKHVFLAAYQLLVELDKVDKLENVEVKEEKAKQIIQHIDQYIELIEIVEEISAIIKIDDLKETIDIAKELRESIAASELITDEEAGLGRETEIRKEQTRLAQKLQTALSALQVQVLEHVQELAPTLSTEVLQRITRVTAQLSADLVAVTGIRVALQAPAEPLTEIPQATVESQAVVAIPELVTATGSEETILEQTAVVDQLSSSEQLFVTTEMLEKAIAVTKETVTSEDAEIIASETTLESASPQIDETLAVEGTQAIVMETAKSVDTEAVIKEDVKLSVVDNQAQEVASSEILETESVSAVVIEDLGPVLHEVEVDEKHVDIGLRQTAELQEPPKATIELLVQHIDQFMCDDITEIINELSNVINAEELKQSISIARELRENIAASEVELKAETSDVLKDDVSTGNAQLAQQLYTALAALENLSLDTLADVPSINKDTLQRVAAITESLRTDLAAVVATQTVFEEAKLEQLESDTKQIATELEVANETITAEKMEAATISVGIAQTSVSEGKDVMTMKQADEETVKEMQAEATSMEQLETQASLTLAEKETFEISATIDEAVAIPSDTEPITLEEVTESEIKAVSFEQAVQKSEEPLKTATTEQGALINHIDEFISEEVSEVVGEISAVTNSEELKETIELAKGLKESLEFVIGEETVSLRNVNKETKQIEQVKLAEQLQDALSVLLDKTLENAEEIAPKVDQNALQKVSDIITHLQEDLEKAIVFGMPDVLNAAEIVEIAEEEGNSMKQLEVLLQEVTDKINIATVRDVEETEALKDVLDEVQTVIIKLKRDYDGAANDTLNETLEDLECSVRSVQLQINEDSPPELLQEACATLQLLVNNMTETQDVSTQVAETVTVEVKTENILEKCSTDTDETVKLLEEASNANSKDERLSGIVSSLNILKDTIKTLKLSFVGNADVLIEKGVDVVQSLDQLEEKVFTLEKDLAEVKLSTEIRDHILTAIHSVYGSISNMRGTISSIQKRYMFENYGKPSETILRSIKNVSGILEIDDSNKQGWKAFSKSLRKVLNHFEDIKFYINLDKTARLPSDAAFTKIILEELKSNVCETLIPQASLLGPETTTRVNDLLQCLNKYLTDMETKSTVEVKEKIPVFLEVSSKIYDVVDLIKQKLIEKSKEMKSEVAEIEPSDEQATVSKEISSEPADVVQPEDGVHESVHEPEQMAKEGEDSTSVTPTTSKTEEKPVEKKQKARKKVLIQEPDTKSEVEQVASEFVEEITSLAIAAVQNLIQFAGLQRDEEVEEGTSHSIEEEAEQQEAELIENDEPVEQELKAEEPKQKLEDEVQDTPAQEDEPMATTSVERDETEKKGQESAPPEAVIPKEDELTAQTELQEEVHPEQSVEKLENVLQEAEITQTSTVEEIKELEEATSSELKEADKKEISEEKAEQDKAQKEPTQELDESASQQKMEEKDNKEKPGSGLGAKGPAMQPSQEPKQDQQDVEGERKDSEEEEISDDAQKTAEEKQPAEHDLQEDDAQNVSSKEEIVSEKEAVESVEVQSETEGTDQGAEQSLEKEPEKDQDKQEQDIKELETETQEVLEKPDKEQATQEQQVDQEEETKLEQDDKARKDDKGDKHESEESINQQLQEGDKRGSSLDEQLIQEQEEVEAQDKVKESQPEEKDSSSHKESAAREEPSEKLDTEKATSEERTDVSKQIDTEVKQDAGESEKKSEKADTSQDEVSASKTEIEQADTDVTEQEQEEPQKVEQVEKDDDFDKKEKKQKEKGTKEKETPLEEEETQKRQDEELEKDKIDKKTSDEDKSESTKEKVVKQDEEEAEKKKLSKKESAEKQLEQKGEEDVSQQSDIKGLQQEDATSEQVKKEPSEAEERVEGKLAKEQEKADKHTNQQVETEKHEKEHLEAEKLAQEQSEATEVKKDRAETEGLQQADSEEINQEPVKTEQLVQQENLTKEKEEDEQLTKKQEEAENLEKVTPEDKILAQDQIESDKKQQDDDKLAEEPAADKHSKAEAEAEKLEKERVEAEKIAKEQAEAERVEKERLEAEKLEKERLEAEERVKSEKLAKEEAERVEKEKLEVEKLEKERLDAENQEKERLEAEKSEKERAEVEEREKERLEAKKLEQDRLEAEKLEKEKLEAEKQEKERVKAEKLAKKQAKAEKLAKEQAEAERVEKERLEAEKLEKERLEAEEQEKERVIAEKLAKEEAERVEKEKLEVERLEKERLEAENREKERVEAEELEKARLEAEKLEQNRLEAEKLEKERVEAEEREKARLEAEKLEKEQLEAEKQEKERVKAEKLAKKKAKADKLAKEQAEAERLEKERLEAEQVEKERLEAEKLARERLEAEKLEKERLEAEKLEKERVKAEKIEKERLEAEKIEKERLEAEKIEKERLEAEKIEKERLEAEKIEKERLEAEKIEKERLEAEKIEKERLEAEKIEKERLEAEKIEKERLEAEKIEKERLEAEKIEKERLEAEKIEKERLEAEKLEKERLEAEKLEKERLEAEKREKERLEAEKLGKEQAEAERLEKERLEAEKIENVRLEAEKREKERLEAEKLEKERLEAEKLEKERVEEEQREKERLAAEKAEKDRLEAEKAEKERLEAEKAEKERLEAEKQEKERVKAEKLAKKQAKAEKLAKEQAEAERLEKERLDAEKLEKERLEAEKVEKERLEAENLEKERVKAGKLSKEQAEVERLEKERVEAEKLEKDKLKAEKEEKERVEAEEREKKRVEAEKLEKERLEAEKLEKQRLEIEKQEQERVKAEKLAKKQAKADKLAKEQAEAERLEKQKLEAEKLEKERLEAEKLEKERLEAEKLEKERLEAEKLEKERLEAEKLEKQQAEAKKLKKQQVEAEELEKGGVEKKRPSKKKKKDSEPNLEVNKKETDDAAKIQATNGEKFEHTETEKLQEDVAKTKDAEKESAETEKKKKEGLEKKKVTKGKKEEDEKNGAKTKTDKPKRLSAGEEQLPKVEEGKSKLDHTTDDKEKAEAEKREKDAKEKELESKKEKERQEEEKRKKEKEAEKREEKAKLAEKKRKQEEKLKLEQAEKALKEKEAAEKKKRDEEKLKEKERLEAMERENKLKQEEEEKQEREKKRMARLEKEKQEEKVREEEEKARLEKKRIAKKKREEEEERMKLESEALEKARKAAAKKRKEEEKARFLKEQEEIDKREQELRENERRLRLEKRRQIEEQLFDDTQKPSSTSEVQVSKPRRTTNGDVTPATDVDDHYIKEYHYEPTRQSSVERTKFVDHNHRDYTMEFSRPPGYRERTFEHERFSERESLGRSGTIYKAKTLVLDSQLRSSAPPQPVSSDERRSERYDRTESDKRVERHRSKALSEARSLVSEKRSGLSRDLKRKPVFSTYLTDRTAVEGSRVKLTCSVLSSSDPKITWYKNGVLLDDKLKYRTKFIDGLITLEVLNAVVSDSAEYTCTVENENGSVNTVANLKVYPSFEASPIPPTFTRSIRDTYHLAENELVLECRIRGQPLPTITWLKDDKAITTNERYQAYYLADGVCRLCVSSPTPEDSGKYTCKAENSVWTDQITHIVSFTGKENRLSPNLATRERSHFNRQALESRRPHFTNVLSDYKVVKGGTIGLQVEIRGCPTRVEWLREGRSVTEVYRNARTFVEQGLYTLALSDVTEKESGLYTCRAWSTHGNVDMNAAITVVPPTEHEGKPAIIAGRPDKDILISVGEDVNISFRVQGEPKPKVVFMKGIRDITTSQRVCKMTSDDYVKFTLKRSVVSDAGTYCILARNAYGCDRAFVTVVVRQRASSENLISDWTYPLDDSALSISERKYKSVPDRIPGEPSVVDGGNNWVSLAWPKADPRDTAPVLAYKIESWLLGKEGGARWVELGITPLNSFDAFNLKQGEEYHFRVTPRNRYGWGESVQTSTPFGVGLAGDRPEFVEILPGQLKVLAGETANLSCSVKGKPVPEIVWMKNGHEIEEESRMTTLYNGQDCSLTIKDICIEDEARYSCEASNVHGRASTYARLAVVTDRLVWEADAKLKRERSQDAEGDYPPQFTMRLRDRRVQATYPVRLTCQVVGNPPPTLNWFKDGEHLVLDSRRSVYQDEHFHTLEIAPTTLEDGGVYEAMARNSSGAVSCRCSLVVDKGIRAYVAPEFCCGLEPLYRLREGDELRISAVVEAYPSVGVTWYRDGVRLRPSRRAIMTLDRDGQIELALAFVTCRDAGVYTCTASNEVGRASTSGKVEVVAGAQPREKRTPPVVINAPDERYSKEPMFVRKPRSSEAREGDTVIIACEVIGDPKPDVYWLRDFLKPDYYRDATHFKRVGDGPEYRFEIPHAKLDYTGAYSVVARNVHGEAKAIISLQIKAKDPSSTDDTHNVRYGRVEVIPRFERELTDLLSYDGDAVEFECHVTGNPEPDIRWFHYNELIRDCEDFESTFEEGAARLKIKQVTAEDEGTYSCEASNNLGKATSSACLVVYPPGEPNTLSQRLRRPPALLSAASTPRSTPRSTPARSVSRTPGPDTRRLCSPTRQMAPSFYTYPFNKVVEEGENVTFKCAVKGQPAPWATWDKDGIIITPSARFTIKEKDELLRILEIEQVTIEDVGVYRITIENEFGRAEASARLEVITQKGKFYAGVRAYSASPRKSLTYRRYPSVPRQD